ncbi:hypothetical protein ABW21_db0200226 [Orbilia brochopaga]|nr:hypothetical protein ABW21_db0200226 [Drechslerella brochopaga]
MSMGRLQLLARFEKATSQLERPTCHHCAPRPAIKLPLTQNHRLRIASATMSDYSEKGEPLAILERDQSGAVTAEYVWEQSNVVKVQHALQQVGTLRVFASPMHIVPI